MSTYWNKDVKRFLAVMAMLCAVCVIFSNLVIHAYLRKEQAAQYQAYSGILSIVSEKYPLVAQEEIIQSLTQAEALSGDSALLRQYGIFEDSELCAGVGSARRQLTLGSNCVLFLTAVALFLLFFLFWSGRGRRLMELLEYINHVSHGNYDLEPQKNSEDELSGIRNELYKLAVIYKEQALQAQVGKKALADSVANISHQLKTPLTSAVILTDNLLESPEMEPTTRIQFLREISRELAGMKWLVVTMLKLSRLDAGVVELRRERISLNRTVEKTLQNLEMMAQWKEIRFVTSLSEASVTGDEKWLSEALLNIVKNAIEHSFRGGEILLETQENEVYSQISVRDYGEGISATDQKHLFERFYRASQAENENMGIGLALAKEIVERMNGSITAESGEEGTRFIIRILKYDKSY